MIITFTWKLIHPFLSNWIGNKNVKIPLNYTARIKRLFATEIILTIMLLLFAFYYTVMPLETFTLSTWNFFRFNAFILLFSIITPVIVLASNLINIPVEALVHYYYYQKAKKKLAKTNIINIGITGSYGKTSTKFFLSAILSEKYKTLHTPSSFNTPMGVSKVINQNDFTGFDFFVAEMGADKLGDINTLCRLVKIRCGIITAIDIQHLETFLTVDNIIKTKLSLFKNIDKNGFGIYNFDSKILQENIKKENFDIPLYSYSINSGNLPYVDITAIDIKHTKEGLEFTALFKDKSMIFIKTELLGRHNVSNLLASILCAKIIGLSDVDIKNGIKNIKPVEHRLQRIDSSTGILILDDGFNANLSGAHEALKVLSEIEGNKKIIVTPGLIGLGEKEEEANKDFGKLISKYTDYVILIGAERTKNIFNSIMETGFNAENLLVANSLNESKDILKSLLSKGDVVLFENDLPDAYND